MKQFNGNNNLWNDNIENQWEACWNHRNESNMENAQRSEERRVRERVCKQV